jgi:hypothetical protein
MSKPKLTPWFDGRAIVPAVEGVYEIAIDAPLAICFAWEPPVPPLFSKWAAGRWWNPSQFVANAAAVEPEGIWSFYLFSPQIWRGLVEQPK